MTDTKRPRRIRRLSQIDFRNFIRELADGPVDIPTWRDIEDLLLRARQVNPAIHIAERTEKEVVFMA